MRICVNTRLLLKDKLEGLGRFSYESLKRITQQHPEHEFIFIFDRKYDPEFIFHSNVKGVVAHPQARHPVLWYLFFEWGIPPILNKYKPDLFFSPDGWLSLRSDIPSLPVIHDLNFFHNPQWVSTLPRMYYNYYFPQFIRKAKRIATVSEFSKRDISSRFTCEASKIDVVYNGAKEEFKILTQEEIAATRKKYSEGLPYFLFLSLVHPRKNLTRILQAYSHFRNTRQERIPFIIVGSTRYWSEETRRTYEKSRYKQDILFLGRLSNEELYKVLGSCFSLVYASLFEGFGIPILEAMRCGIPVITSDTTSMPEVGGQAVCYADPYRVQSISNAMNRVFTEEGYRNELIKKGFDQAQKFTWQKTADRVWKSMLRTMEE